MNFVVQQTSVDKKLKEKLKKYAKLNNFPMQDVFTLAVNEFIELVADLKRLNNNPRFYSSPIGGYTMNIKIPSLLKNEIMAMAKIYNTSARRIYYTAIIKYAIKNKIIESEEEPYSFP